MTQEQRLAMYMECEAALLTGRVQEFREANHWARMLELRDIQRMIRELQDEIAAASAPVFTPVR